MAKRQDDDIGASAGFEAEEQAGIADEQLVPKDVPVAPAANDQLDRAPYQPELEAGIADENAIPASSEPPQPR